MSLDKEAKLQALEKRLDKMEESMDFLKNLLTHLNRNIEELKKKK